MRSSRSRTSRPFAALAALAATASLLAASCSSLLGGFHSGDAEDGAVGSPDTGVPSDDAGSDAAKPTGDASGDTTVSVDGGTDAPSGHDAETDGKSASDGASNGASDAASDARSDAYLGPCTPDASSCIGSTLEVCTADGSWAAPQACPPPTVGGAYGSGSCTSETACGITCEAPYAIQCVENGCVDLANDRRNCGACGNTCGTECFDGGCLTATAVAVDGNNSCALLSNGSVWCWGDNTYGQLGQGSTGGNVNFPVAVTLPYKAIQVAVGEWHVCALLTGGAIYCWGDNASGQLGLGADAGTAVATPTQVEGLSSVDVSAIGAGQLNTCAIVPGAGLYCWGDNTYGQGGPEASGSAMWTPVGMEGGKLPGVPIEVSPGSTTCAVVDGGVWCWGDNPQGQTGSATYSSSQSTPTEVALPGIPFAMVRHGGTANCALETPSGGDFYCWGENLYGQFGNGNVSDASAYTPGGGTFGPTSFAVGEKHMCYANEGNVECAGDNTYGQIGNGSSTNPNPASTAGVVVGLSNSTILASGPSALHTCAIIYDAGAIMCWGADNLGQLGNDASTGANPLAVPSVVLFP